MRPWFQTFRPSGYDVDRQGTIHAVEGASQADRALLITLGSMDRRWKYEPCFFPSRIRGHSACMNAYVGTMQLWTRRDSSLGADGPKEWPFSVSQRPDRKN